MASSGYARPHRIFGIFACTLVALSSLAFYSKSPVVFYRFDGTYLLISASIQEVWSIAGWDFTSNPLEGIGGLELPWQSLFDPALWLIPHMSPIAGPVAAMTLYAAMLAAAIGWLGKRLGLANPAIVAAMWTGMMLALPYVYPSLGFDFLWGVPSYIPLILEDTAVILLFFDFGRGPRGRDAARGAGVIGICLAQACQYPNFAPVSLLVLAFFGLVAVIAAASMRERGLKLALGAAAAGLTLALFGQLMIGLYGFAKPTYFWKEFYPRPGTFSDLSFFIAEHSRWPGRVAYGLALVGALHAALAGAAVIRPLARGFLTFIVANLLLLLAVDQGWKGPRIAYIDIFAYPFYCVFAAHGVATALGSLSAKFGSFRRHTRAMLVVLSFVPWLVLLDLRPPPLDRPLARNLNPFIWPPLETPITRFLVDNIALRPKNPFRGRVASIAGSDFEPQWVHAPFITQHNYDGVNLFFSGNDHRMYGLWYYGIPTLLELNQFSSPFFHLVNARLLNAPGARDLRSYETQSVVNDRIMALLGVRYLISDKRLPDRPAAIGYRLVEGRDLFVYDVPEPNLAGYAVNRVQQAADAQGAIAALADPSFDPRTSAIVATANDMPQLARLSGNSSLVVERGGYRIAADSAGTSLLVLPVEYSHCLRAKLTSNGAAPPRLLRADVALAAVLFTGHVEGRLMLRYGPLSSGCRIEDWREADALKLGEAREWPKMQ